MPSLSTFDGPERRKRTRFPIALVARYAVDGRQEIAGMSRTVNISSQGVLMRSAHEVSPGTSIEVAIEWPILIGNSRPLALHLLGRVIRSDHGLVAVEFRRYEFRIQSKPPDLLKGTS
jgi:PilZ domain-containing protein